MQLGSSKLILSTLYSIAQTFFDFVRLGGTTPWAKQHPMAYGSKLGLYKLKSWNISPLIKHIYNLTNDPHKAYIDISMDHFFLDKIVAHFSVYLVQVW